MPNIKKEDITAVVLAGGQARRMEGQDKGLIMLGDQPMIKSILDILEPQAGKIIINANRNHDDYARFGYEIVADALSGYCGPLAGMASALNEITTAFMVTSPCDTPFIPNKLVERLANKLTKDDAEICVVDNGEHMQPVFCMMKKELLSSLQQFLEQGGRKIDRWFEQHKLAIADFSDMPDAFDNINTPEDIEEALQKLKHINHEN